MHNSVGNCIFKSLAVVMCVILCGCSIGGIGYKNVITEENADEYSIYMETPFISGIKEEAFGMSINNAFSEMTSLWKEDFKTRIDKNSREKAELSVVSDEKFNKNGFISIIMEKSVYTGGPHGNIWRFSQNIDLHSSRVVSLDDLFIDSQYTDFINRRMTEIAEDNPSKYSDLWQTPKINDRQKSDFYIHDGNLIIFYQPYDLSYYAKGIVDFEISVDSLRGYIKPEYAERFK